MADEAVHRTPVFGFASLAEADAFGDAAECGQGRVALEALAGTLSVHRLEVVEAPHAVEAQLLREAGPARELRPGHALLGDVESEPHRGAPLVLPADGSGTRADCAFSAR